MLQAVDECKIWVENGRRTDWSSGLMGAVEAYGSRFWPVYREITVDISGLILRISMQARAQRLSRDKSGSEMDRVERKLKCEAK